MKQYKVIDEYVEQWGAESEIVVTEAEVERLAAEWGVSVEKLKEQLDEIDE